MATNLNKAREIYQKWKNERLTSREGIAITDCRAKETMVVTRYGGDIVFTFFDDQTGEFEFFFVVQMAKNSVKNWNDIFGKFAEIKAKLVQR